ncbi:uncharacterized protein LOC143358200 [Halictus rubicundus]|uniref:uncharacterized protein LOC143358200 n=1 Tax=Halictus rubicundus TaxID=77578 RepID=UPI004036D9C3
MDRWTGKVAVVTGASSGIGAAIVKQLVRNGMMVAGLARRVDKMKELAESLEDGPGNFHPVECDVSKEESVVSAFAWVQENLGPVNVLVNNAGITKESSLIDGNLEDWREVFEVNVLGLCVCTREAVRMMRQDGEEGVVINVNSLAAERVPFIPGFSVYPASKRSIAALAQTLRHELTGTRIRVTGISPGLVATELMISYSTYSEEALASFPTLDPDDVAAAAVYILSCGPNVVVQDIVLRPLGESWRKSRGEEKKKALAPPELRYKNPHQEVMKLRVLWMDRKPLTKSEEIRDARGLYKQAQKLIQTEDDHPNLIKMIKRGLFLQPRFHGFYGLDGEIYRRQGKLTKAIQSFENARQATKFDMKMADKKTKNMYNDQLIDCYTERGNWHYDHKRLTMALGDYEQVFQLKTSTVDTIDVQHQYSPSGLAVALRGVVFRTSFQRYEKAMQYMLQDKLETAAHVIYKSKLTNFAPESHVLLGDCFLRRGEFDLALESYLKYRKMARELQSPDSTKDIEVLQRIIDILNEYADNAIKGGRSKDAVNLADRVIQMLNEDELGLNNLRVQRGDALLNKTRGIVQMNQSSKKEDPKCCETAAEGLVFLRDPNDTGLAPDLGNLGPQLHFGIKRAGGPPKNADRLRIVCTVHSLFSRESKTLPTTMEQKFWSEKIALITGASSGIGRALVESLISKGMKVVGIAPSVDKMKLLADELKNKPGKFYPLQCDLTNQGDIQRVLEWIEKNLGALDILINNAAINMKFTMQNSDMEDWKKILDVNLLGLTCMTKEVLKMMRKKGIDNGMIMNINDVYSWRMPMFSELPWSPAYIASKIAMTTMTECLRAELAKLKSNVKVMCISSGLVESSMTAQFLKENPQMALKPKDVADCILFAMQTPENVLIRDMVITPVREMM